MECHHLFSSDEDCYQQDVVFNNIPSNGMTNDKLSALAAKGFGGKLVNDANVEFGLSLKRTEVEIP